MTWFKNGLRQEWTYVLSAQRGYWTLKVPLSAFTWPQFREQTFCGYLLSFCNLISYSINSFTFTCAHTFHMPFFLLLFSFLLILIHPHHHSILSHIKSNACLFCIHVLRDRKLAVLECDCSRSGVDLGRLKYLHSSLTTFLKAVSSSPELWESPTLRHIRFDLRFNLSQVVKLSSLFCPPAATGMFRRNIISKSSHTDATFCLKFCVFLSELNPACLTFKCLLIKVNR